VKVLFLIQGHSVAASRYRVLQYLPYLQANGVEPEVSLYPSTVRQNFRFFASLPRFDIVFLQRKRFNQPRLGLLRRRARRIVYDFDDSVMYRNSRSENPISGTRRRRFIQMIKASDFVIAGNGFLKEEVLPFQPRVAVVPTVIDQDRYPSKEYGRSNKKVTIGWIGDHGSLHYLEKMKPVFEALGRRYSNLELKIVCDIFFDCEHLTVVKKPWTAAEEVSDLQSFDIGVMPLVEDPWSWGKCGLKIIQYQGVGLPVVCTPVGVNKDLVEDHKNGLWAGSAEEWEEKLGLLIEDPELREKMGREGRSRVLKGYTLQACAPRLLWILKSVAGNHPDKEAG
jgi:glycosyltransferase involved in cell wall biosynthesis